MASFFASTRDFVYRRRRPLVVVGGIVGGVYMVANYAISKLTEMQTRMVEERRDRENLRRRFAQNQEDCSFTILALLPTLGDQLFSHMDVEGLTAKLQRGRQSPSAAGSKTPVRMLEADTAGSNGIIPAAVDESTTSLFEPSERQEEDKSQEAMEEIWSKLGTQPKSSGEHPISNGINGTHTSGASDIPVVAINGEAGGRDENEADNALVDPQQKNGTLRPSASSSSGLDAFSEPAPKPISTTARLTPSPSGTPSLAPTEFITPSQTLSDVSAEPVQEEEKKVSAVEEPTPTPVVEEGAAPSNVQERVSAQSATIPTQDSSTNLPASTSTASLIEKKEPSPEVLLAEKRQKLALWNELKIAAFSRTITTLYSVVLLSLQTHVQLNLLGRYAYLSSVASLSAPSTSSNHRIRLERHDGIDEQGGDDDDTASLRGDDDDSKGIDIQTERLYLTFSWWFLHEGWRELAQDVQEAVQDVFGSKPLKTQLTHQDFLLLLNKVRRRVEFEKLDEGAETIDGRSEWSEMTATTNAAASKKRGKRKTFLSVLFPPTSREVEVLEKAGAFNSYSASSSFSSSVTSINQLSTSLPILLDETKDIIESRDFARILRLCLSRVFDVFEGTLRPTFGVEPRMTSDEMDGLLRQSSQAAAAATSSYNPPSRFQQLTDDEKEGVRVRLASLFPAVARQSSAAISGVPNEYVDAVADIKELKAFSAVIYSSWT